MAFRFSSFSLQLATHFDKVFEEIKIKLINSALESVL